MKVKKKKILVSVINNISTDQRVEKVCNTLRRNGYEISLIGTNLNGLPKLIRPYKTQRFSLLFHKGFGLFAEFNLKLFRKLLLEADKNTILLANDLDSLLPNYLVSKIRHIPLVFDSHEIYSELPSVQGRFSKKIWKSLEKYLIPNMHHFYTVSNGYARYFQQQYGVLPEVITNAPDFYYQKNTSEENNNPKIILYQGAIKKDRGLESLLHAMSLLPEYQLWIIGYGTYEKTLKLLSYELKLKNIQFLGRKTPDELRKITRQASVGISLEENSGLSYYYALPNKLFDYIHSGVPVVGTYLPEIKSVVEEHQIGETISKHDPVEIAAKIRSVIMRGKEAYQDDLKKTAEKYCWENQEKKLLEIYFRASISHK
ncbi:MAG: glycosyltransferase [Flavobacteriaceae bacterium]|jgi:glycosyltransferase involved in cell wall biosynthesis|nr:glycosyltransferase [Flavobacteriaceae bacterium]